MTISSANSNPRMHWSLHLTPTSAPLGLSTSELTYREKNAGDSIHPCLKLLTIFKDSLIKSPTFTSHLDSM